MLLNFFYFWHRSRRTKIILSCVHKAKRFSVFSPCTSVSCGKLVKSDFVINIKLFNPMSLSTQLLGRKKQKCWISIVNLLKKIP